MNAVKPSNKMPDLKIFGTDRFSDFRGSYTESYNEEFFQKNSDVKFVQDDFSISRKNVLRGLHGDLETWKLVSCPFGELYFVAVDMREGSETYLSWDSFILSPENANFILVPPGFANGHLVMSDQAVFHYKQSSYYGTNQFTVKHDDQRLQIFWPNVNFLKSQRDS